MRNCWNAGCSIWMRPGSNAIRKKGNFQAANPLCGSCAVQQAKRSRQHFSFIPAAGAVRMLGNCLKVLMDT